MLKFLLAVILLLTAAVSTTLANGQPERVTICHAAGRADEPANWVTLTLPWVAVYGQAGHFNENGTPQAGHEEDYLGACPSPITSAAPTPTPTAAPTMTPTPSVEPTPLATPTPTPSTSTPPSPVTNANPSTMPDTAMDSKTDTAVTTETEKGD